MESGRKESKYIQDIREREMERIRHTDTDVELMVKLCLSAAAEIISTVFILIVTRSLIRALTSTCSHSVFLDLCQ